MIQVTNNASKTVSVAINQWGSGSSRVRCLGTRGCCTWALTR